MWFSGKEFSCPLSPSSKKKKKKLVEGSQMMYLAHKHWYESYVHFQLREMTVLIFHILNNR
jgi:hypothetical protein